MRINVYAEEMTDKVSLVRKGEFTGVRFWLQLPVTVGESQIQGPFMHRPGDDDSAAVTFWGKRELRRALKVALDLLERDDITQSVSYGMMATTNEGAKDA